MVVFIDGKIKYRVNLYELKLEFAMFEYGFSTNETIFSGLHTRPCFSDCVTVFELIRIIQSLALTTETLTENVKIYKRNTK